jgi:hypothetical protein
MKILIPFLVLISLSAFAAEEKTKFDEFLDKHLNTTEKNKNKKKDDEGLIDPAVDKAKKLPEASKKEIEKVTGKIIKTEDLREDSFGTVMLGYRLFTTWIPSQWTASYTQNFSRYWTVEGEYARGSLSADFFGVDLGEVTEERVTLQARHYPGNSFNISFGLLYQKGSAELGADIPKTPVVNAFEMENFGVTAGLGNRWQWENGITVGVDWIRINQPLFNQWENDAVLKYVSASDARHIKRIMRNFNTLPTFVVLGFAVGYTF